MARLDPPRHTSAHEPLLVVNPEVTFPIGTFHELCKVVLPRENGCHLVTGLFLEQRIPPLGLVLFRVAADNEEPSLLLPVSFDEMLSSFSSEVEQWVEEEVVSLQEEP